MLINIHHTVGLFLEEQWQAFNGLAAYYKLLPDANIVKSDIKTHLHKNHFHPPGLPGEAYTSRELCVLWFGEKTPGKNLMSVSL